MLGIVGGRGITRTLHYFSTVEPLLSSRHGEMATAHVTSMQNGLNKITESRDDDNKPEF